MPRRRLSHLADKFVDGVRGALNLLNLDSTWAAFVRMFIAVLTNTGFACFARARHDQGPICQLLSLLLAPSSFAIASWAQF